MYKEGIDIMGILKKFGKILQAAISGDAIVTVRKYAYEEILEASRYDEDEAERHINQVLLLKSQADEKKRLEEEKKEKKDVELIEYYRMLDKYLNATLGLSVVMGITSEMAGKHEWEYVMKNYSLNKPYRYLSLELERNGETFKITFDKIEDIKFNDNGQCLKTWIYMDNKPTHRFYLHYNEEFIKGSDDRPDDRLTLQ
jgi:hypothetical protein